MRNKKYAVKKGLLAEINVVPYIDVMLVLLVIFMITAPMLTQGVHVNLPHAQSQALKPQKALPIVVSVNREGQYFLNLNTFPKEPITPENLAARVAALMQLDTQQHKTRGIYVKGDRSVDYGKVVQAMAILQKAGASGVGLITAPY